MKKLFILAMALLLCAFVGCYDSTPYDRDEMEAEYERGHGAGYSDGYQDGYLEGFEAGQLSILEATEQPATVSRPNTFPGENDAVLPYYVTQHGECYHRRDGCNYTPYVWYGSADSARAAGYRPCSKCCP